MNNLIFYILNIFLFALPMALFEISIEKSKGWGGGFPKDKWYAKSSIKGTWIDKVITKITRFDSPLNYHIILMIIFHLIFILEYIFLSRNIFLILACYLGVNFFADLFWFSFNWYFDSMRQLLKGPCGSISWHKSWIKIGKYYIPKTYPIWFSLSMILLVLSLIF
jgi:hypothetical protein